MQYLTNFQVASPLLALGVGALVVLLLDLVLPARRAQYPWFIASVGAIGLAAYYAVSLWPAGETVVAFSGALLADPFGLLISLTVLGAVLGAVLLSLHRREDDLSGYLALSLWAALGMLVLAMAGNLLTVFLGLEIFSLALYVLVAFRPGREAAREGALKYFVLGSVAAGFMLFGFALIYGSTGTMDLAAIREWVTAHVAAGGPVPMYLKVGVGLALVGFGFKLALVPFHAWAPDAYQGAPTAVTAFMATGTKAAAFAALVRFLLAVTPGWVAKATLPLAVLAGISMLVGALGTIRQTNLKRLLAYSGITSAGYLFLGLPGLTENGLGAGAFYLLTYLFTGLALFAAIAWLNQQGEGDSGIESFRGLLYRKPVLAVAVIIALFSLTGLPPTGGFAGKFLLALAAAQSRSWELLGVLVLSTGIAAYAYLKVLTVMVQKPAEVAAPAAGEVAAAAEEPGAVQIHGSVVKTATGLVLGLATLGILVTGLFPNQLVSLVQQLLP